jgi:hypothetical protein
MTDVFGAPVSRNTLLLIASLPDPPATAPRVVGVDEYAQRKDRICGTVLVDVETRCPIDLRGRLDPWRQGMAAQPTAKSSHHPANAGANTSNSCNGS